MSKGDEEVQISEVENPSSLQFNWVQQAIDIQRDWTTDVIGADCNHLQIRNWKLRFWKKK